MSAASSSVYNNEKAVWTFNMPNNEDGGAPVRARVVGDVKGKSYLRMLINGVPGGKERFLGDNFVRCDCNTKTVNMDPSVPSIHINCSRDGPHGEHAQLKNDPAIGAPLSLKVSGALSQEHVCIDRKPTASACTFDWQKHHPKNHCGAAGPAYAQVYMAPCGKPICHHHWSDHAHIFGHCGPCLQRPLLMRNPNYRGPAVDLTEAAFTRAYRGGFGELVASTAKYAAARRAGADTSEWDNEPIKADIAVVHVDDMKSHGVNIDDNKGGLFDLIGSAIRNLEGKNKKK